MVMRAGSALTTQMRLAGARSEIAVVTGATIDSVEATPFPSLTYGTTTDSLAVQGWPYDRTVSVSLVTPILARVDVTVQPTGGAGPTHAVTSYVSAAR